ncbi:MAG: hypothetical protein LAT63_14205 [Marinobacter sp.]|nr:hypothetical protein [Marinobacter sp.]
MELILIIFLLITFPAGIAYLNSKAKSIFAYMEDNHKSLWVKLGSPKRIPGIMEGTKDPAFPFLFEGGYEEISDKELILMCRGINKASKVFAVLFVTLIVGLLLVGAANIWHA